MKKQFNSYQKIIISSCGARILLETPNPNVLNFFLNDPLPLIHIPSIKLRFENRCHLKADFHFQHHQNGKTIIPIINQNSDNAIEFETGSKIAPGQFLFALLPIFEKLYEKHQLYSLHSGTVILNNTVIFIIGGIKTGKSTISSKLHFDYGAKFISDERNVLDLEEKRIVGGGNIISLRKDVIKNKSFSKNIEKFRFNDSLSTSKAYYCLQKAEKYPIKIKKALFVFPHFSSLGYSFGIINDFTLSYFLYENITSNIRACLSLFVSDAIPVPSQDTNQMAILRAKSIKRFIAEVPHRAIDIEGNLQEISSRIIQETNSL